MARYHRRCRQNDRRVLGGTQLRGRPRSATSLVRRNDKAVNVMDEARFDISDRVPREITLEELQSCDYVVTMGCSTFNVADVGEDVDIRNWALDDPTGRT